MNISVTATEVVFHDIKHLVEPKPGVEVEVLVLISSICILATVVPIVKYDNKKLQTATKRPCLTINPRTFLTIN